MIRLGSNNWYTCGGFPPGMFISPEELRRMAEDELWFGCDYRLRVVPWEPS